MGLFKAPLFLLVVVGVVLAPALTLAAAPTTASTPAPTTASTPAPTTASTPALIHAPAHVRTKEVEGWEAALGLKESKVLREEGKGWWDYGRQVERRVKEVELVAPKECRLARAFFSLVSFSKKSNMKMAEQLQEQQRHILLLQEAQVADLLALKKDLQKVKELITNATQNTGPASPSELCPGESFPVGRSCYLLRTDRKTWDEADASCRALGGRLAEPSDPSQLTLQVRRSNGERFFLGWTDREHEGNFVGASGRPLPASAVWKRGEPNSSGGEEDCVDIMEDHYKLNDGNCDYPRPYVCEFER